MWGCTIESKIDNSSAGSALHLLYPPVCQSRRDAALSAMPSVQTVDDRRREFIALLYGVAARPVVRRTRVRIKTHLEQLLMLHRLQ